MIAMCIKCSMKFWKTKSDEETRVQAQWLMPIIPATWEVEFRRITVQGQPTQKLVRHHLNKLSQWQVPIIPPRREA
jgi:hypothetical protein